MTMPKKQIDHKKIAAAVKAVERSLQQLKRAFPFLADAARIDAEKKAEAKRRRDRQDRQRRAYEAKAEELFRTLSATLVPEGWELATGGWFHCETPQECLAHMSREGKGYEYKAVRGRFVDRKGNYWNHDPLDEPDFEMQPDSYTVIRRARPQPPLHAGMCQQCQGAGWVVSEPEVAVPASPEEAERFSPQRKPLKRSKRPLPRRCGRGLSAAPTQLTAGGRWGRRACWRPRWRPGRRSVA
jgi:hypothetical protein